MSEGAAPQRDNQFYDIHSFLNDRNEFKHNSESISAALLSGGSCETLQRCGGPVCLCLAQPRIQYECSLEAVLGAKPKVRHALTAVKYLSCSEDSEKQSTQCG